MTFGQEGNEGGKYTVMTSVLRSILVKHGHNEIDYVVIMKMTVIYDRWSNTEVITVMTDSLTQRGHKGYDRWVILKMTFAVKWPEIYDRTVITVMTGRTQRGRGARARRRPSQTEILAGNVRDLTELVRTLVNNRRDTNVVQFPEQPPEAAESTPSRPPRSGSRPRNPSPTGTRGSDRTRRESPRRQQQERADPSRVRSRSRHSQATRSAAAEPPAATGVHRRIDRERSVDKPAKVEDYNQNRLDQLQRQLDQLVGQQYEMDQLGAVAPPFTLFIMASPYPTRFKMPSVNPYDGSTDADEHIENYQAHMLIQNANEAALCKSFCLTLTGAARQWYRRLAPGSIGCFKQLADAFAAAFLSSKTRKLGASHLFGIKQGETEALKKYLERFDRAVVQVESCTDKTMMQAFREGVKDARLVWTLAYDRPPTFAQLRGIAWRHAEADEYVRGRGLASGEHSRLPGRKSEKCQADHGRQDKGKAVVVDNSGSNPSPRTPAGRFQQYTPLVTTIEHVLNQVTGRGLLRDPPPLRADRARRNQNKYCNFHKDVGHDTKDCIQLRDQIELLIRDGHLREFVERIITLAGPSRPAQAARRNPRPSDHIDEQEQEHIVHTIFGGTATGDTASSRRSYVREARQSYDRTPTKNGRARPGPTCPCRTHLPLQAPNPYGSRTTCLITGHRSELDVPDQDSPALAGTTLVVLGSHVQPTKVGVG
ncbi:hypothetical protein TIFTF001_033649 [Ficus carica]|uniref:Retrotransposon gag domain-containing protein n=1 Tax=Ficus carica TaxID=3494 RepID=A0AA88J7W8_FICCA|nr:hypothetical protein TIFTF001_033649 [Ficus carica]